MTMILDDVKCHQGNLTILLIMVQTINRKGILIFINHEKDSSIFI